MGRIPNNHEAGEQGPAGDPVVAGLLGAYADGVFPMAHGIGGPVYWYDPDPRGIIPLPRPEASPETQTETRTGSQAERGLRISTSLRARVRSGRFTVTTDEAFDAVIHACGGPRTGQSGEEGWIDDRIIDAYTRLHRAGHAHSVEAWLVEGDERRLVGGLYGVHLRGLFAGESMFSRPDLGGTDASKVCLVWLWHHLRARGFTLLDPQVTTDHLRSLGGLEIPREAYRARLAEAMATETAWLPFEPPSV
jgi:leucyl/phenylalanyl-tRNA--protein transferase